MTRWDDVRDELREHPRTWLVTGAAGFIGSNLVEELLLLGQRVRGLDDFSTGKRENLAALERRVGAEAFSHFTFHEGSILDAAACREAVDGAPLVLHQAALGSVPRSIADPAASFAANVTGFVTLLEAARCAGVERFVYASSSSVYGDHPGLPKREAEIGEPLSPYAATKRIDEVWAKQVASTYGIATTGLRYFNVVGPRQDPEGPYAAVIPRWIAAFQRGESPTIFGDGETSRDFCPVANVVQMNVLAALGPLPECISDRVDPASGRSFNVALGTRTSLNELFFLLRDGLAARGIPCGDFEPEYADFRPGDVRHSLADLSDARAILGYEPEVDFAAGIEITLDAFLEPLAEGAPPN
ncbi:MAG TPA: NAD-dependent epimerase/dehydratase family protein [Planctomycetes bacterium]|nr:NAD-dependent epimerase/dehydratase family protein [Planctomycetota bacterium]